MQTTERIHRSSLFGPTLLIGLGLLLLLSNLGYLQTDVVWSLLNLWPLLLIAAGLDILFGRSASWVGAVIALLLMAVMLATALWAVPRWGAMGGFETPQMISQPLEKVESAEVTISSSVSRLSIAASEESQQLIEGKVTPLRNERILTDYTTSGDMAHYTIRSEGPTKMSFPWWRNWGDSTWTLRLNPNTPIRLTLQAGVGEATLDLSQLTITDLNVNNGVGQTTITLPHQGALKATVKGGVGEVIVNIPRTMAARIHAQAGLGGVDVDPAFSKQDDHYVSDNYESSSNRIDVSVEGGIGVVRVRQVE